MSKYERITVFITIVGTIVTIIIHFGYIKTNLIEIWKSIYHDNSNDIGNDKLPPICEEAEKEESRSSNNTTRMQIWKSCSEALLKINSHDDIKKMQTKNINIGFKEHNGMMSLKI